MTIIFYNDGEIWSDTTVTAGDYIYQVCSKVKRYALEITPSKACYLYLASAGTLDSITDFRQMFVDSNHVPTRTNDTNYAEHFYLEVHNGEIVEQGYYYCNAPIRYPTPVGSPLFVGDSSACLAAACLIDIGLSSSKIIPQINKHSRIKFEGNECMEVL